MTAMDEKDEDCHSTNPQRRAYYLMIAGVLFLIPGGILTGFISVNPLSVYVIAGSILLAVAFLLILSGLVVCCVLYGKCKCGDRLRANMVQEGNTGRQMAANADLWPTTDPPRQRGDRTRQDVSFREEETGREVNEERHPPPADPPP